MQCFEIFGEGKMPHMSPWLSAWFQCCHPLVVLNSRLQSS